MYADGRFLSGYYGFQDDPGEKRGADTIVFASCIKKGTPIGYPCPFAKRMHGIVSDAAGETVTILDYTH